MHRLCLGNKLTVSRKEETLALEGAGGGSDLGCEGRGESGKRLEEVGRGILTFSVFYKTRLYFIN